MLRASLLSAMSDPSDESTWIEISTHLPPGVEEIIDRGGSTFIGKVNDCTVLKYPLIPGQMGQLELEDRILRHLGPHPNIIEHHGITVHGLLLSFAENGSLKEYIKSHACTLVQKLLWSKQIAEVLDFIHSKNVIHCDLNPSNILLDSDLHIRLCDFQGRLHYPHGEECIDGGASEYSKYRLPSAQETEASEMTDLFALGSVIYYILHDHEPYPELDILTDEDKIRPLFESGSFPSLEPSHAGDVIKKCWQLEYASARGAVDDLAKLLHQDGSPERVDIA